MSIFNKHFSVILHRILWTFYRDVKCGIALNANSRKATTLCLKVRT